MEILKIILEKEGKERKLYLISRNKYYWYALLLTVTNEKNYYYLFIHQNKYEI